MKQLLKKTAAMLMLLVMVFGTGDRAFADETDKEIKIGLTAFRGVASLDILNTELRIVSGEDGRPNTEALFGAANGFLLKAVTGTLWDSGKSFDSFESAQKECLMIKELGCSAAPVYLGPGKFTVYISGLVSGSELNAMGYGTLLVSASSGIGLFDGEKALLYLNKELPVKFSAAKDDDTVKLKNASYRGSIEILGAPMKVYNTLMIEDYLCGVVPGEMPSGYEAEALKAQAVAARTYTFFMLENGNSHKQEGYELCDTVHCQVYKGAGGEAATTNSAVLQTKGIKAYYNGKPINAVFFASSGGMTDNSENVWLEALPYLRAVPEVNEVEPNSWSRTFTEAELTALSNAKGYGIGTVTDISLEKFGNRVQKLTLVGTNGKKTLQKEEIRTFFSAKGGSLLSRVFQINGSGSDIDNSSDLFSASKEQNIYDWGALIKEGLPMADDSYVIGGDGGAIPGGKNETAPSAPATPDSKEPKEDVSYESVSSGSTKNGSGIFVFTGTGNGHGVGMSQKGARGMAQKGYSYEEILKHYYTGITLE